MISNSVYWIWRHLQGLLPSAKTTVSAFLALFCVVSAEFVFAGPEVPFPTISMPALSQAVSARMSRVPELDFIRTEAKKMGIKVYLFGGTAAGFAHYVKWDLQLEAGDTRFQPDRFDYDFTNIYRSTQDLDIVIDGDADQANALAALLKAKFQHLQGTKEQWEVRLLKTDMGDKQALLNNPDFLNQNTDSNSTGMIEVTVSTDPVIRDLRDWNSATPQFLRDVAEGKIHYYNSPLHATTSRFREGKNPEIFSVIRYLTKAFQYELEMRPEELDVIQGYINRFDVNQIRRDAYASKWLEEHSKKLIRHAVNIEYAWNTLERLGLRNKLIEVKKDSATVGSLAWWLSREPLRSKSVGTGTGKTARELKLDVVAHEAREFMAFESIMRAHTGEPNVLTSRQGASGEAAVFGNGFYTQVGRAGAIGSGLTIRFRVNPEAREGTDFIIQNEGKFIIFRNKNAFRVIPASLNISYLDFFKLISDLDPADRGMAEKLRRKFSNQGSLLTNAQVDEIAQFVLERAMPSDDVQNRFRGQIIETPVLSEWLKSPFAEQRPEILRELIRQTPGHRLAIFIARLQDASRSAQIVLMDELLKLRDEDVNSSLRAALTQPTHRQILNLPAAARWVKALYTPEFFTQQLESGGTMHLTNISNPELWTTLMPNGESFAKVFLNDVKQKSGLDRVSSSLSNMFTVLNQSPLYNSPELLDILTSFEARFDKFIRIEQAHDLIALTMRFADSDRDLTRLKKVMSWLMLRENDLNWKDSEWLQALGRAVSRTPAYHSRHKEILTFLGTAPHQATNSAVYYEELLAAQTDAFKGTTEDRFDILRAMFAKTKNLPTFTAYEVMVDPLRPPPTDLVGLIFQRLPSFNNNSGNYQKLLYAAIENLTKARLSERERQRRLTKLTQSWSGDTNLHRAFPDNADPTAWRPAIRRMLLSGESSAVSFAIKTMTYNAAWADDEFLLSALRRDFERGKVTMEKTNREKLTLSDHWPLLSAFFGPIDMPRAKFLDLMARVSPTFVGTAAILDFHILRNIWDSEEQLEKAAPMIEQVMRRLKTGDELYFFTPFDPMHSSGYPAKSRLLQSLFTMMEKNPAAYRHSDWLRVMKRAQAEAGLSGPDQIFQADHAAANVRRGFANACKAVFQ